MWFHFHFVLIICVQNSRDIKNIASWNLLFKWLILNYCLLSILILGPLLLQTHESAQNYRTLGMCNWMHCRRFDNEIVTNCSEYVMEKRRHSWNKDDRFKNIIRDNDLRFLPTHTVQLTQITNTVVLTDYLLVSILTCLITSIVYIIFLLSNMLILRMLCVTEPIPEPCCTRSTYLAER